MNLVNFVSSLDYQGACFISLGLQKVKNLLNDVVVHISAIWDVFNHLFPKFEVRILILRYLLSEFLVNQRVLFFRLEENLLTHYGKCAVIRAGHSGGSLKIGDESYLSEEAALVKRPNQEFLSIKPNLTLEIIAHVVGLFTTFMLVRSMGIGAFTVLDF